MLNYKIKAWIANYWFSLILVACSIYLAISYELDIANIEYKAGLDNDALMGSFSFFISLPYYALAVLLAIIIIIHLARIIIKASKRKINDWIKHSLAVFSLLILSTMMPINPPTEEKTVLFLRGNEKWIANEVDIPAIREWLTSLPADHSGKGYYDIELYPEKLPEAITRFNPQFMQFSDFDKGR